MQKVEHQETTAFIYKATSTVSQNQNFVTMEISDEDDYFESETTSVTEQEIMKSVDDKIVEEHGSDDKGKHI